MCHERTFSASVVLPNFNGLFLLRENLDAIRRAARRYQCRVVVADDASSDGSAEWVERNFSDVTVVRSDRRVGFGENCNRILPLLHDEILVLLNTDVWVGDLALDVMLRHFSDSEVFAVNPSIRMRREDGPEEGFNRFTFHHGLIHTEYPCKECAMAPSTVTTTAYGVGAAVAYSLEKLRALGGFDPIFSPYYYEDADLSFRAWRMGWRVLFEPRTHVVHGVQRTIGSISSHRSILAAMFRNQLLFNWLNLSSQTLVQPHAYWLLRYPLSFLAHGRRAELAGYLKAMPLLPRALRSRRHRPGVLKDLEVLRLTGAQGTPADHSACATKDRTCG